MVLYDFGWLGFDKISAIPVLLFLFVFWVGLDIKKSRVRVTLLWFLVFGLIPLFFIGNHLFLKSSYELGLYTTINGAFSGSEEINSGRKSRINIGGVFLEYSLTGPTCFSNRLLIEGNDELKSSSVGPFDIEIKNEEKNLTIKYIGSEDDACIVYISSEHKVDNGELVKSDKSGQP